MDGFDAAGKRAVVIGATNRKVDLDPALMSRFDLVRVRIRVACEVQRIFFVLRVIDGDGPGPCAHEPLCTGEGLE